LPPGFRHFIGYWTISPNIQLQPTQKTRVRSAAMRFEVGKDVELSVSYPLYVLDLEEMVSSSPKVPKVSLFHVPSFPKEFSWLLDSRQFKTGALTQH